MKIDGIDSRPPGTAAGAANAPVDARKATVGEDTVAPRGEAIAITADGQALNDAAERIRATPEVDQNLINAVKQALEKGEYTVDATRVAEKILGFEETL